MLTFPLATSVPIEDHPKGSLHPYKLPTPVDYLKVIKPTQTVSMDEENRIPESDLTSADDDCETERWWHLLKLYPQQSDDIRSKLATSIREQIGSENVIERMRDGRIDSLVIRMDPAEFPDPGFLEGATDVSQLARNFQVLSLTPLPSEVP